MQAIISGVADTAVGKVPGSSCLGLHVEAATAALADAGLKASDIDGVLCAYSTTQPHMMLASVFCEFFGLMHEIQRGGAGWWCDGLHHDHSSRGTRLQRVLQACTVCDR